MKTYNENVLEMAEKMAKLDFSDPLWARLCITKPNEISRAIEKCIPKARIAVDMMAEGFDEGKIAADNNSVGTTFLDCTAIQRVKQDLGLIKPTDNDTQI